MKFKRNLKKRLVKLLLGRMFVIGGIKIQAEKNDLVLKCDSFEVKSSGQEKTKIKINGKPFNYATRLIIDFTGDSVVSEITILGLHKEV